jgi:hypothetical protein
MTCWLCRYFQTFAGIYKTMKKQICPACEGRKQTFRFVNRGYKKGCENGYYPCEFCGATGEVEPEKFELLELGKQLRQKRVDRRIMMRECARSFGCDIGEWTNLENARATKQEVLDALVWFDSADLQSGYVKEQV